MDTKTKAETIKSHVLDMLEKSFKNMVKKVDKAVNSGAVDVDDWSADNNPMTLPKIIVIAILKDESTQYEGKGTSFEKQIKKEVKNLRYFL
jgi:hypothetical protein